MKICLITAKPEDFFQWQEWKLDIWQLCDKFRLFSAELFSQEHFYIGVRYSSAEEGNVN